MDFNCLVYQCIRGDTIPAYTSEGRGEWEKAVLDAVRAYTLKVWTVAGKPARVFIGVDGVVPMAKIRQQRLRRFKSRWMAGVEMEAGVRRAGEEVWDTNAITPGTEFMEKLGRTLHGLASTHSGWIVSAADEAGEGEQKLMAWIRDEPAGALTGKKVVVYGLDADLIVLSLIAITREAGATAGWSLLRELTEFEGGRASGSGFGCLNVKELLGVLGARAGMPVSEYILDYACAMSFLGNDFLPHSLSVRMREGGHDVLCKTLREMHETGYRLVRGGRVQSDACLELVRRWSRTEEWAITEGIVAKYKMRPPAPRNDRERLMRPFEELPLRWAAEAPLMAGAMLVPGWKDSYRRLWLKEAPAEQVCAEYKAGLQWILDYYLGKPISYSWYFPWSVPPLWEDLERSFAVAPMSLKAPAPTLPVAPQEQLAMVLPMSSWWLIRDANLKGIPSKAPVFWPTSYGFFSAGRRWLWECEPDIPILCVERLRQLV
jgi:5'-3' exoribonuclease 2